MQRLVATNLWNGLRKVFGAVLVSRDLCWFVLELGRWKLGGYGVYEIDATESMTACACCLDSGRACSMSRAMLGGCGSMRQVRCEIRACYELALRSSGKR